MVVALFTRDMRERKALPLSFGDVRARVASARAFPLPLFEPTFLASTTGDCL
jgi:hypothetical protein